MGTSLQCAVLDAHQLTISNHTAYQISSRNRWPRGDLNIIIIVLLWMYQKSFCFFFSFYTQNQRKKMFQATQMFSLLSITLPSVCLVPDSFCSMTTSPNIHAILSRKELSQATRRKGTDGIVPLILHHCISLGLH